MSNYRSLIKISRHIYISIFALPAFVFFVTAQGFLYAFLFLLCALIHEFSHLLFLYIYGAKIYSVTIFPFGIDISADTSRISYKKELICTLAGSISNLVFAAAGGFFLQRFPCPPLLFFIMCNIFLGCMNLIPLSFFDGGKALRLILYDCLDIDRAFYIHKSLDIFSALIFVFFSLFIITGSDFNISVIFVILYAALSTFALYIKIPCRKS